MHKFLIAIALSGAVAAAAAAEAKPLERGQTAASLALSGDFPIEGDVHGGAVIDLPIAAVAALRHPGEPDLDPALTTDTSAQLRIGARSFDDIYDTALGVELEGALGLGGAREAFGAVRWLNADEGDTQVGTAAILDAQGADLAEVPVFGRFGEYEAISLEAGLRQYFKAGAGYYPYVAGRLGVAFVDEIKASFAIPDLTITQALNDLPFYGETTTWSAGLDVGVSFQQSERVQWQLETGLRYAGELDGDDSAIGGLGLASINDEGDRLSVPVTARLRVLF